MKPVTVSMALIAALGVNLQSPAHAQETPATGRQDVAAGCQQTRAPGKATGGCAEVSNILPDGKTAYTVGIAVLKARYGAGFLRRFMPYETRAYTDQAGEDIWCLVQKRHYPKGKLPSLGGGSPELCLLKRDGRVTRIGLSL